MNNHLSGAGFINDCKSANIQNKYNTNSTLQGPISNTKYQDFINQQFDPDLISKQISAPNYKTITSVSQQKIETSSLQKSKYAASSKQFEGAFEGSNQIKINNQDNYYDVPPVRQPCPTAFGAVLMGHTSQNSMSDPKIVSLLMMKAQSKQQVLSQDNIDPGAIDQNEYQVDDVVSSQLNNSIQKPHIMGNENLKRVEIFSQDESIDESKHQNFQETSQFNQISQDKGNEESNAGMQQKSWRSQKIGQIVKIRPNPLKMKNDPFKLQKSYGINKRPMTSLSGRTSRQQQQTQVSDQKKSSRQVIDLTHLPNSAIRARNASISPPPENFKEPHNISQKLSIHLSHTQQLKINNPFNKNRRISEQQNQLKSLGNIEQPDQRVVNSDKLQAPLNKISGLQQFQQNQMPSLINRINNSSIDFQAKLSSHKSVFHNNQDKVLNTSGGIENSLTIINKSSQAIGQLNIPANQASQQKLGSYRQPQSSSIINQSLKNTSQYHFANNSQNQESQIDPIAQQKFNIQNNFPSNFPEIYQARQKGTYCQDKVQDQQHELNNFPKPFITNNQNNKYLKSEQNETSTVTMVQSPSLYNNSTEVQMQQTVQKNLELMKHAEGVLQSLQTSGFKGMLQTKIQSPIGRCSSPTERNSLACNMMTSPTFLQQSQGFGGNRISQNNISDYTRATVFNENILTLIPPKNVNNLANNLKAQPYNLDISKNSLQRPEQQKQSTQISYIGDGRIPSQKYQVPQQRGYEQYSQNQMKAQSKQQFQMPQNIQKIIQNNIIQSNFERQVGKGNQQTNAANNKNPELPKQNISQQQIINDNALTKQDKLKQKLVINDLSSMLQKQQEKKQEVILNETTRSNLYMQPTERLYNYYDSKFQVSPSNQIARSAKDLENVVQSSLNSNRLQKGINYINGDSQKSNIQRKLEILQQNSPFQNNKPLKQKKQQIEAHMKLKEKQLLQNDSPNQEDSKLMSENELRQSQFGVIEQLNDKNNYQFKINESKLQESPVRDCASSFCPSTTPPVGLKPSLVSKNNNPSPTQRSENIMDTIDIDKKIIVISSQKVEKKIKQKNPDAQNKKPNISADHQKQLLKLDLNKITNKPDSQSKKHILKRDNIYTYNLANQMEAIKYSESNHQNSIEKCSQDADSIERFPLNITLEGKSSLHFPKNTERSVNNSNILGLEIDKKVQTTARPVAQDIISSKRRLNYPNDEGGMSKYPLQSQNSTARQSMGNPLPTQFKDTTESNQLKNSKQNNLLKQASQDTNSQINKSKQHKQKPDSSSLANQKDPSISELKSPRLKLDLNQIKNQEQNEMEKYFKLIIDDNAQINKKSVDCINETSSFDSEQKSSFESIHAESLIDKTEKNSSALLNNNNQSINLMHSNYASSLSKISKYSKLQEILGGNYLNSSNMSSYIGNQTQQSLASEDQSNKTFIAKVDNKNIENDRNLRSSQYKTTCKIDRYINKIKNNIDQFTTDEFDLLRQEVKNKGFIGFMKENQLIEVQDQLQSVNEMPFEIIEAEQPDSHQDMLPRKIVIKNQNSKQENQIQCTGFMSSAKIYFFPEQDDFIQSSINTSLAINSDFQNKHKASILPLDRESKQQESQGSSFLLNDLISQRILNIFVKLQCRIISCGFEHCIALMDSAQSNQWARNKLVGRVFSWGLGASGCLGHGDYQTLEEPREVIIKDQTGKVILAKYLEAGGYHNGLIANDGKVYMWGRGDVGQLGIPKSQLQQDKMGFVSLAPRNIDFLGNVLQISLGDAHTLLLSQDKPSENCSLGDQVYSCGWNDLGQLGIGEIHKQNLKEFSNKSWHNVLISNLQQSVDKQSHQKIKQIKCGAVFSAALTENGSVYTWGSNSNGQMGGMSVFDSDSISKLDSKTSTSQHQLSNQTPKQQFYPKKVQFDLENPVIGVKIQEIFAGDCHVIARANVEILQDLKMNKKAKIEDKLYAWGQGILVEKFESSDVVCNKPVVLGDGIENVMNYNINAQIEKGDVLEELTIDENIITSSDRFIQGTLSSNSNLNNQQNEKSRAITDRYLLDNKQISNESNRLRLSKHEQALKIVLSDNESNLTTIKNTQDYRNYLKKESSDGMIFSEKQGTQQQQVIQNSNNFNTDQESWNNNKNANKNLKLNLFDKRKHQDTLVSSLQIEYNYLLKQGFKTNQTQNIIVNSMWTSEGTDCAKVKEQNSNNSLITIGAALSQESNFVNQLNGQKNQTIS